MSTDRTLLELIWLASPALPIGAFGYSEGLEAAVDAGHATDEAGVGAWLLDQLIVVQARGDLALAAAAITAWRAFDGARIGALNNWVRQTRESSEFRLQSEQAGRSMAEWLRQRALADSNDDTRIATLRALSPAPTWPVAYALAAARSGAALRDALLAMAFGWAENMVQAAVRSVPLGQSAGQRVLASLADAIPAAVDDAMQRDDHTRQAYAPMLAIVSAHHQTQYSRLFRS